MSSSESKRNECTKKEISGQITPSFSPAGVRRKATLAGPCMIDGAQRSFFHRAHKLFQPRARVAIAFC